MTRARLVVLVLVSWAGTLAGAFVAGRGLGSTPPPERPRAEYRGASAGVTSERSLANDRSRCVPAPSADTIRAILREELLAARPTGAARGEGAPDEEDAVAAPDEPIADAESAGWEDAQAVVEEALARGTWTMNDRESLRARLGTLTRPELDSIMRSLIPAANAGRLHVSVDGPIL